MGGKPSQGTPADQRLSENQTTSPPSTGDTDTADDTATDTGNDQPYDTLMPWAPR